MGPWAQMFKPPSPSLLQGARQEKLEGARDDAAAALLFLVWFFVVVLVHWSDTVSSEPIQ